MTKLEPIEDDEAPKEYKSKPVDPAGTFEFVTGLAGTGKSYQTKLRHEQHRGGELVATTGIAAINVGGVTINSLLRFFDTNELKNAFTEGWLKTRLKKLWLSGTRRLYLDEVSMLDGNQLTYLTRAIDEVNEWIVDEGWEEFTGSWLGEGLDRDDPELLGLTLVGDFCQLPPVKAPFAFQSPEWRRFADNTIKLTEIKRQQDKEFAETLNLIRAGRGIKACEFFRDKFEKRTLDDFGGPTIMAKNDEVDRYNQLRHDLCEGEPWVFRADKEGKQRPEWKQIPEELVIKEGAQVMILANRTEMGNLLYVNGDIGTLLGEREGQEWTKEGSKPFVGAAVKLHRTDQEVVVKKVTRENKEPRDERKSDRKDDLVIVEKGLWQVVGSVTYMPLRLAYATTVHKSQGLSLDHVQVNILSHMFMMPGMMYVALSRARTPDGLRLIGSPEQFIKRCVYDPKVKGYL